MRDKFAISVVLGILAFTSIHAQDDREWIKVLPESKKLEKIVISAQPETQNKIPLQLKLTGMSMSRTIEGGVTYNQLAVPGAGVATEVGKPELPVMRSLVKIPLGATPSLQIIGSRYKTYEDYTIYPVQEPWAEFERAEKPAFKKDAAVYSDKVFFPKEIVKLGTPAVLRGIQVVPVEITPVQYNPVTKQIRVHYDIKWQVKYAGGLSAEEQNKSEASYSELFAPMYQKAIINYQMPTTAQVAVWDTSYAPLFYKADYLIITHDNFFSSITPLADAKRAKGLTVRTVKTSDIKTGGPTAAEIADYIKRVYKNSYPRLSYVLLVGDADFVPTNYVHNHPDASIEQSKQVGTDFYYSTMDGAADYLPDLAVGRLPGRTADDISNMVIKILEYDKSAQVAECWFKNVLICGQFQDNDCNGIEDRWFLQTSEEIRQYLKKIGFRCATVYTAPACSPANKLYHDGVTPFLSTLLFGGTTQAVVDGIDYGVFLVTHRDHGDSKNGPYGSSDGWGSPSFAAGDVSKLSNKNEYPVVFSINCRSGWFDGETDKDGGATKTDCLGEALLKKRDAGAAGFIGSTRISYSGHNDAFAKGLIDALWSGMDPAYTATGTIHLGNVLNYGKIYMAEKYGYPNLTSPNTSLVEFEEFNVLGDPEMQMKPTRFLVHPGTIAPRVLPYVIE